MGAYEFSPASGVSDDPASICHLYQNYPNPFSSGTVISYRLPSDSHVTVSVYNVLGQEVRALVDAAQRAGDRSVAWDGRSNSGQDVSPGTYFLKLRAGNETSSIRMLLSD